MSGEMEEYSVTENDLDSEELPKDSQIIDETLLREASLEVKFSEGGMRNTEDLLNDLLSDSTTLEDASEVAQQPSEVNLKTSLTKNRSFVDFKIDDEQVMETQIVDEMPKPVAEKLTEVCTGQSATECAARAAIEGIMPISSYFRSKTPESPAPLMLGPDHGLMERFQASLRQHLLRQKEKLLADITSLRFSVKSAEKEEDELGEKLFHQKKDLNQQRKFLDERQNRLRELAEEKLQVEKALKQLKEEVKAERAKYEQELQKEQELRLERDRMRLLEKKMREWKANVEDDMAVNQRISEKTEAERRRMLEENRRLDMYILRLMTEINKLESEQALLNDQLDQKEKDKELLNQTVADANADLQDLENDQKRLLSDWNSLIVATSQRDTAYAEVVEELRTSEEAFRTLNTEIESFKKSAQDEIKRSESLGLIYGRANTELENSTRKQKELIAKKTELERILTTVTELTEQATRDTELAKMQSSMKEQELASLQKTFQNLSRDKQSIEDKCLDTIIEQSTDDKTAMYMNKEVKAIRENVREQETYFMEYENKMSRLIMQTEDLKLQTGRNLEIISEMNKEIDADESILALSMARTRDILAQTENRQIKLMELMKKIKDLTASASSDTAGMSCLELRVRDLEWSLRDLKKGNDELQAEWMRQQSLNVKLANQRSDSQKGISLLRKQVVLLDQKRIKLNKDLDHEHRIESEIKRTVAGLHLRLKTLNADLSAKTDHRHFADKELLLHQTNFIHSLKEAEEEQLEAKREISDLERLLEERAEVMLEVQREMLAWEKKYKMAQETKQNIEKEKSSQGDIGQMKQEINRMEIRYGQLRKVQEKLIADMEGTIRRREAIVEEAEAREKRDQSTNRSRANFQRKLNELKNRIKMIRQEEKMMEALLSEAEGNHQDLVNQLNEKNEQVINLKAQLKDLKEKIEDGQLKYQQSVEVLVRRQRRCKLLAMVKDGKYRPIHRNEILLENDLGLAKSSNCEISAILEALMADFPAHKHTFSKILTSLRPDVI